jgi:hypothetical protein
MGHWRGRGVLFAEDLGDEVGDNVRAVDVWRLVDIPRL